MAKPRGKMATKRDRSENVEPNERKFMRTSAELKIKSAETVRKQDTRHEEETRE